MPAISGGKFVVGGGASLPGFHIGEQLAGAAREVVLLGNLSLGTDIILCPTSAAPLFTAILR